MIDFLKQCYQDAVQIIRDKSGLFNQITFAVIVIPIYFFFTLYVFLDTIFFEVSLYLERFKHYLGPYNRRR